MINSVKLQSDGYLVNGILSVPMSEGNRDYQEVQKWIKNGGVVEPEFTQAELSENARTENNNNVIAQIEALEKTLSRPLREYALDNTNTTAHNKITQVEADIVALRADLL